MYQLPRATYLHWPIAKSRLDSPHYSPIVPLITEHHLDSVYKQLEEEYYGIEYRESVEPGFFPAPEITPLMIPSPSNINTPVHRPATSPQNSLQLFLLAELKRYRRGYGMA